LYTIQTIKDKSYKDEYGIVGIILARFLFIPGLSIPIAITSAYAMMQNPYSKIIKVGYFDYVSISLFVLIVYFVVTFFAIKKIPHNLFHCLIRQKDKMEIINLKKYFYLVLFIIFTLGSVMEINRAFWVLWIESIILLFLIISINWLLMRHCFEGYHCVDLNANNIASLNIYRFFIRYGIAFTIICPIYFTILAILLIR